MGQRLRDRGGRRGLRGVQEGTSVLDAFREVVRQSDCERGECDEFAGHGEEGDEDEGGL